MRKIWIHFSTLSQLQKQNRKDLNFDLDLANKTETSNFQPN